MNDELPPTSFETIQKLVEPLLDFPTCERVSLNKFRHDYKNIIAKLYESGSAIVLRIPNQTRPLLLCSPKVYLDLEEKRRCICEGFEEIRQSTSSRPQAGKMRAKPRDDRIAKLHRLNLQIHAEKTTLRLLNWQTKEQKEKVSALQVDADALRKALRGDTGAPTLRERDGPVL